MALVGELSQGVDDAAAYPARVFLAVAKLLGDAVGRLEADAPDVIGQAVGIFLDLVNAFLAVGLVDFGGEGCADAVSLQDTIRFLVSIDNLSSEYQIEDFIDTSCLP